MKHNLVQPYDVEHVFKSKETGIIYRAWTRVAGVDPCDAAAMLEDDLCSQGFVLEECLSFVPVGLSPDAYDCDEDIPF